MSSSYCLALTTCHYTCSLTSWGPSCRDVFNEKPTLADAGPGEGGDEKDAALVLPRGAVIHTTKGDITLKLFPEECPKTIENFSTHAKNGYYDGIIFHRVIKGFMLQTGDPLDKPPSIHRSDSALPWPCLPKEGSGSDFLMYLGKI